MYEFDLISLGMGLAIGAVATAIAMTIAHVLDTYRGYRKEAERWSSQRRKIN